MLNAGAPENTANTLSPRVELVAALSTNGVIGFRGSMPWHLPSDLRRFRAHTLGFPIVMGRATFESIGRALPGRENIVIASANFVPPDDVLHFSSPEQVLLWARESGRAHLMIIGGAKIYASFLARADLMHLTRIHQTFEGDTFFPEISPEQWQRNSAEDFEADEKNPHSCTVEIWSRK